VTALRDLAALFGVTVAVLAAAFGPHHAAIETMLGTIHHLTLLVIE